jgi:DNA-binding response OmpR family regulator
MSAGTILIVDDDRDTVAFVRAALEPIGMKVISAEDGEKGLELAKSAVPDLVILDVFLPGKLGFFSLLDFKSAPETRNIPIIMLTSVSSRIGMSYSADDMRERFGAQPDAFLDKPVEPGRLQSVVRELLGGNRGPERS